MNILYLADPNSVHDIRWINFFAECGVNCYVIVRERHFRDEYARLDERIQVVGTIRDPSTIRPIRVVAQLLKIKTFIKAFRIDLLHILYAEPNALWANARSYFRCPVVVTTRGSDVLRTIPMFFDNKSFLGKAIAWQYRRAFRFADMITCTSIAQQEQVRRLAVETPVVIVRTGVDFRLVEREERHVAESLGIRTPFILMPRKMEPLYDHAFTLDAISLLSERIRNKFTFVFLNADTPQQLYYRKIADKADGIQACFHFIPSLSHEDLICLYKQASLVIMNPRSDGSPVSAMEAMACRVPVILPPLPYDPDLFVQKFSFATWTPEALKTTIETVLSTPEPELHEMLDNQYHRIRSEGNTERQLKKVLQIYNDLCL